MFVRERLMDGSRALICRTIGIIRLTVTLGFEPKRCQDSVDHGYP